jgi:hypothetical protein
MQSKNWIAVRRNQRANASVSAGLAMVLLAAVGAARAQQLTLLDVGPVGTLLSVCSGFHTGTNPNPGNALSMLPGQHQCNADVTTQALELLQHSASYTDLAKDSQSDAEGYAQMGQLGLASSFRSNSSFGFTVAAATAGWNDVLMIAPQNPAQNGQSAVFSFPLAVSGVLKALPMGNSGTQVKIGAYRDNGQNGFSQWSVGGQGQTFYPYDEIVNSTIILGLPVTLGQPFQFGLYARATSGSASSGPNWISEASNEFLTTITWQGVDSVTVGGQQIAYTLSSQSGTDWTQPFKPASVPEVPGSLPAAGLGMALAWSRRIRRRVRPGADGKY